MTRATAVARAEQVFESAVRSARAELPERAGELLFDAAEAVCKLLTPYVTRPVEDDLD